MRGEIGSATRARLKTVLCTPLDFRSAKRHYPFRGGFVNRIGLQIEERRRHLGMSRRALAEAIGVTSQTVLNLERDADYNIGTTLLRKLELALRVEFRITMREDVIVNDRIRMGNDEFILHIRKRGLTDWSNDQLGKRIWEFLRDHAEGQKVAENVPCIWNTQFKSRHPDALPRTAAEFEFRADALPAVYRFLGELAERSGASS